MKKKSLLQRFSAYDVADPRKWETTLEAGITVLVTRNCVGAGLYTIPLDLMKLV